MEILAAAYAKAGDFEAAVEWQSKAIEQNRGPVLYELRARLEQYRAGRPIHGGPNASTGATFGNTHDAPRQVE
jgi:hypothetical protein